MIALTLITAFSLIAWSIVIGISSVALAILLVKRAQARHDSDSLKRGLNRLSQQSIDNHPVRSSRA